MARDQFLEEDFCDFDFLFKLKRYIKGWCLLNQDNEWIGCCFISSKYHEYNPKGIHFLEICVFPKFRNKGYGKYLLKIMFDNSVNYKKSVCINPDNEPSKNLFKKHGFKFYVKHKRWNVYKCDKSFYPNELLNLKLTKLTENEIPNINQY